MKKNILKDLLFYTFAIIMVFLLYQRDIGGSGISKFVFVFVVVAYAITADFGHLMMALAFVLPLTNGLPGNYILPILCVLLIIKGAGRFKIPNTVWIAFITIALWELFFILFLSKSPDIPFYIGFCSAIFLLFFVGGTSENVSDNSKNALWFCIGSIVMTSIIMLNFQQMMETQLSEMGVRIGNTSDLSGEEGMSLQTNPNNIGLYSIASITISFALWYYKKIPVWLLAIIAVPAFLAGVYSFSRTWILTTAFFVFLLLLYFRKGKSNRLSLTLLVVATLVGVYYFFTNYGTEALEFMLGRFQNENLASGGDRIGVFEAYNQWMTSNPWSFITGVGTQTYKDVTDIYNSPHNAFHQILLAYGLPGLFLFVLLLYRCFKKWHIKNEKICSIPFWVILLFLQTSQFLMPFFCMFPLVATLFVLKMVKYESTSNL